MPAFRGIGIDGERHGLDHPAALNGTGVSSTAARAETRTEPRRVGGLALARCLTAWTADGDHQTCGMDACARPGGTGAIARNASAGTGAGEASHRKSYLRAPVRNPRHSAANRTGLRSWERDLASCGARRSYVVPRRSSRRIGAALRRPRLVHDRGVDPGGPGQLDHRKNQPQDPAYPRRPH